MEWVPDAPNGLVNHTQPLGEGSAPSTPSASARPSTLMTALRVASQQRAAQGHVQPACPADLAKRKDERLFLMGVADPFHGTTALQQALMASEQLSTLCNAKTWQCEGSWILCPMQDRLLEHHANCSEEWFGPMSGLLTKYGEFWDLERPVLFDKSPRLLKKLSDVYVKHLAPHVEQGSELPTPFSSHHVRKLRVAYVIMWRPICLSLLGHDREVVTASSGFEESRKLKKSVDDHLFAVQKRIPAMVVSLAHLLWKPAVTQRRLERFLPCLHGIDLGFVPQPGRHIFAENKWKAQGSVRDFGLMKSPESVGYNLDADRCEGRWTWERILPGWPSVVSKTLWAERYLADRSVPEWRKALGG